ncbi:hypothetical protein EYZ11_011323 [Aspergillus tanneri]|uniref:Uncharacterized protein n=1 Tax=Aspergillus tanneri TaxID=1220188 RepID=A0A4S3J3Q8_9EURO|nr:hypothetical protein EYZ11_011323 [Aspergillus tanneri]
MPLAHGIDRTEWENSGRTLSYNFKHNFCLAFGLAYMTSLSETSDQWGNMSIQDWTRTSDGGACKTPSDVFCAINVHIQHNVYRFGGCNRICYHEQRGRVVLVPYVRLSKTTRICTMQVNFDGSLFDDHPATGTWSKRDAAIGKFGEWDIEKAWFPLPENEFQLSPGNLMSEHFVEKKLYSYSS